MSGNARGEMKVLALTRTFWECLGKALGWPPHLNYKSHQKVLGTYGPQWRVESHRLYDLILTGGDIEKFWEELVSLRFRRP